MDEIFDLVDEDDKVIGSVTRTEAHTDKTKIHREIGVVIIDKDNRVLLQQRSQSKSTYPGKWVNSAGGHLDRGEQPLDAAHRELREELGFDTELFFLTKELDVGEIESTIIYWYMGIYNNEVIQPIEREVSQVQFYSKDALSSAMSISSTTDISQIESKDFKNNFSLMVYKFCQRVWGGEFVEIIDAQQNIDPVKDEPVYLIDKNDAVLGKISRNTANSNHNYIHREVGVLIFDDDDRLLFQQRELTKHVLPGVWTPACAGHVTFGDTYIETAHKELEEEVGFDTELVEIYSSINVIEKETHLMKRYLGKYNGETLIKEKGQVRNLKFLSEKDVEEMINSEEKVILEVSKMFWDGEFDEAKAQL